MFLQLLLSGVILECSSLTTTITPTLKPNIAAQVLPSFPKLSKSFSFSESNNNNGQQTPWKPIAPPNYHPIQSQNARSSNGNVANQNKNYESNTVNNFNNYPVFPKSTINFKIDSTGYPMDVKQYTDLSAFKKYQGPNPQEIPKPKYDDIMARLYNDPVTSRITPSSRSTRESYKPYDSTKSIEFIPSFTSKSKPFQFQEFPMSTRGFSSKPLNKNFDYRKGSFITSPSNEGYYSSQDDKFQTRYNPSGPAKKAYNFNTAYGSNGGNAKNDHYQLLSTQPQLHFNTQGVNQKSPMIYPSLPFERIRADVEVINKKKKPSFPSHNNDDDDDDGDNDNNQSEEELGSAGGESLEEVKPSVSSSQNSNPFEMPGSNIFDSYDQTFGNFSNNKFPKRPVTIPVSETAGSIQQNSQESTSGEDHKENIEFEENNNDSTSKSAEHYDEAETRTSDKAHAAQKLKTNSPYKNFGDDFEREFEESYKREIPKEDYKHVKEVPEIDEPVNKKNKYLRKKDDIPSRRVKKYTKTITQRNTPKEYNHYVTYHSDDADKKDSESRASNKVTQKNIPSKTQPIFGSRIGKPPRRPDDNANKTVDNKFDNKKNIDRSDTIIYNNNDKISDEVSNESSKRVMVDVNDAPLAPSKNPFEQMKPPSIHSFDIYTNAGWKYVDNI